MDYSKSFKKESPFLNVMGMGGGVSSLLTLASGEITYVDDVFSTFLYHGTGAAQTITNGIDLDGEGGMVWIKSRDGNLDNNLFDTERGAGEYLISNSTQAEVLNTTRLSSFNSNGFSLGDDPITNGSGSNGDLCSWTFRKCPGFFDIQTYTGNGTGGLSISHDLGSVPGFIIVKSTSLSEGWFCYHRSLGNTKMVALNGSGGAGTATQYWNDTSPTDSTFTVGTDTAVNSNGATYVAYLFAHNDGSFGEDSDEAVIKCGTYTGSSSYPNQVDVGFEPQWVLIKQTSSGGNWALFDMMRLTGAGGKQLSSSVNTAEATENGFNPTATGFELTDGASQYNGNGDTYIYIAIRRPHKPPEAATEVFDPELLTSASQTSTPGFAPDMAWQIWDRAYPSFYIGNRLTGNGKYVQTYSQNAEGSFASWEFDAPTGEFTQSLSSGSTSGGIQYFFKRAPKFFDVVTYTGNGVTGRSVSHNLGVAPELLLVKCRSNSDSWAVYASSQGSSKETYLNGNIAFSTGNSIWTGTDPTATAFYVKNDGQVNTNGRTYIGLLFASLSGVSKIGTYTGTGSDGIDVDCGFTSGARLVIIKRTDSTGNWFCWDSARGIVSGNDPYVFLNSTSAEDTTTDYIDPLDAGFTVNGSSTAQLNASGGTYLFLAIA